MYEFNDKYETFKAMTHKVKIYQCSIDTPYKFMDYEFAKKKGLTTMENFNENYRLVAEFKMKWEDEPNADTNMLNTIYDDGNNGELQKHYKMHSISMSDIIEIDGRKHYVDTFGFVEMR